MNDKEKKPITVLIYLEIAGNQKPYQVSISAYLITTKLTKYTVYFVSINVW